MPATHDLIVGSVKIPLDASYSLEQTYEVIEQGAALLRKMDGSAVRQTAYTKLRSTISGQGKIPPGLASMDFSASFTLYCMAPRSIYSASTTVTLPAARRSDWAPHAYAIVDGRLVKTPISIATNTGTLTAVSGATGYYTDYYPTLSVFSRGPVESFNGRGGGASWSLTCEEA